MDVGRDSAPFWGLSQSQSVYVSRLVNLLKSEEADERSFCSLTVQPSAEPMPFRSHNIALKPANVRRAVLKD